MLLIRPPEKWGGSSIKLPYSKSYSTRLLALSFLSNGKIVPGYLSDCGDVKVFHHFLNTLKRTNTEELLLDAGDGAAVARFGLAIAAASPGAFYLDGSAQLRKRPMGALVAALRSLSADIRYAGVPGHLPLIIHGKKLRGGEISIPAEESSQYASALALLGSILPAPLFLHLEGAPVSLPYLDLSLALLCEAGIFAERTGTHIEIQPGPFKTKVMDAPADWSAASYAFALHSLSTKPVLKLPGLQPDDLQADVDSIRHFYLLGVDTDLSETGITLKKTPKIGNIFTADLLHSPDLLPALAISAAGNEIDAHFSGIPHLSLKESNRIHAIQAGLQQAGIETKSGSDWLRILPGAIKKGLLTIDSFGDHRIAMAFSLLSLKSGSVVIKQAECVEKSWPGWWEALGKLGFDISEMQED